MKYFGKIFLFLFLLLGLAAERHVLFADDLLPTNPGRVSGHIIIQTPLVGKSERPAVYNLKKWVVEEKADPVQHALEVYKKKSTPSYTRRIWLTGKMNGKKRLIVEYAANGTDDQIVFSPAEDFMYYRGLTPGGQGIVYGVNLLSNKKFTLGSGENFHMVNCPDQKSYVVVQPNGQGMMTQVYSISGERMKTLTDPASPLDIEKSLCR